MEKPDLSLVVEQRIKQVSETRPVAGVSAVCSVQCFDIVGWVTGRSSNLQKKLTTLYFICSLAEQVKVETRRELDNRVSPEKKWPSNRMQVNTVQVGCEKKTRAEKCTTYRPTLKDWKNCAYVSEVFDSSCPATAQTKCIVHNLGHKYNKEHTAQKPIKVTVTCTCAAAAAISRILLGHHLASVVTLLVSQASSSF